ncbi:MAG: hypothetical protein ACTSRK_11285 [Promethearchaeota archaeon]
MPYCNICGKFENVLDFRKLCSQCAKIPLDSSSRNGGVRQQRQIMRSSNNSKFLYYPVKIQDVSNFPFSGQQSNGIETPLPNSTGANSQRPGPRLPSLIPNSLRESLFRQLNIPAHLPVRSQMAIIAAILGWILLFIQELIFLSIFFHIFALIMALRARRSEPRNKLYILALILSISYWIVIIVGTIYLMSDPELMAMLNQQLEEQMV